MRLPACSLSVCLCLALYRATTPGVACDDLERLQGHGCLTSGQYHVVAQLLKTWLPDIGSHSVNRSQPASNLAKQAKEPPASKQANNLAGWPAVVRSLAEGGRACSHLRTRYQCMGTGSLGMNECSGRTRQSTPRLLTAKMSGRNFFIKKISVR